MEIKPENASESVKSSASRIVIVVAKQILVFILALFYLLLIGESIQAKGQEKPSSGVFIRFKVVEPTGEKFRLGFLPMLAYGQLANFKPTTLEEKWIAEPRDIVKMALDTAKITPVAKADVPVVETSLLTGPNLDFIHFEK